MKHDLEAKRVKEGQGKKLSVLERSFLSGHRTIGVCGVNEAGNTAPVLSE